MKNKIYMFPHSYALAAQTACLAMFANFLGAAPLPGWATPWRLHGLSPSRCSRRMGRMDQLLVGFGATVGREPGAMAGFSCAASSATASGSDPKWHWVEDEARHWGNAQC